MRLGEAEQLLRDLLACCSARAATPGPRSPPAVPVELQERIDRYFGLS